MKKLLLLAAIVFMPALCGATIVSPNSISVSTKPYGVHVKIVGSWEIDKTTGSYYVIYMDSSGVIISSGDITTHGTIITTGGVLSTGPIFGSNISTMAADIEALHQSTASGMTTAGGTFVGGVTMGPGAAFLLNTSTIVFTNPSTGVDLISLNKGNINMKANSASAAARILNLPTPSLVGEAAPKDYVDSQVAVGTGPTFVINNQNTIQTGASFYVQLGSATVLRGTTLYVTYIVWPDGTVQRSSPTASAAGGSSSVTGTTFTLRFTQGFGDTVLSTSAAQSFSTYHFDVDTITITGGSGFCTFPSTIATVMNVAVSTEQSNTNSFYNVVSASSWTVLDTSNATAKYAARQTSFATSIVYPRQNMALFIPAAPSSGTASSDCSVDLDYFKWPRP